MKPSSGVLVALVATVAVGVRATTGRPSQLPSRPVFVTVSPERIEIWHSRTDGRDRRLLFSEWAPHLHPGTPGAAIWAAASSDGEWLAYKRGFEAPAEQAGLWLVGVHAPQHFRVAETAQSFSWSSDGPRLLYGMPRPPSPGDDGDEDDMSAERGMPSEPPSSEWHVYDTGSGRDRVVAGFDRKFYSAGPWIDLQQMLFWKAHTVLDYELMSLDASDGVVRSGSLLPRKQPVSWERRPGHSGWVMAFRAFSVAKPLSDSCEFHQVDTNAAIGPTLIEVSKSSCYWSAWQDENVFVVTHNETPGPFSGGASLYSHDLRTRKQKRILGSPGYSFTLAGSRTGEFLVAKATTQRATSNELRVLRFNGRPVGTIYRGESVPLFAGWVR